MIWQFSTLGTLSLQGTANEQNLDTRGHCKVTLQVNKIVHFTIGIVQHLKTLHVCVDLKIWQAAFLNSQHACA